MTMRTIKIILLAVWAMVSFIALVSESESLTAFSIVHALGFVSAWLCIKVCRKAEANGLFSIADDSDIFDS